MRILVTMMVLLVFGAGAPAQSDSPKTPAGTIEEFFEAPILSDDAPPCEEPCCQPAACCSTGVFYVHADALFLNLNDGDNQSLVLNQTNGRTRLTSNDLGLDYQTGYRIAVGASLGCSASIEALYFGVNDWDSSRAVSGDNDLRIPGDLALATDDFFGANRMDACYSVTLHNAEANYFQRLDGNFELLAGFRYMQFSEDFNLRALDADAEQSDYSVATDNRLYGGQLGARWRTSGRWLNLDFIGKAGIFCNEASQSTFVGDQNNTLVLRNSRTRGSAVSFLGELGLQGSVCLARGVYLHAGYNLFWLQGLARAPEQLDFTDTAESGRALRDNAAAFVHGANAGLEFRW